MYVAKYYSSNDEYWEHVSSRYPVGDPRGRSCLAKRHFLVAPDGRAEEVDDAERAAGALPRLEIEQRR